MGGRTLENGARRFTPVALVVGCVLLAPAAATAQARTGTRVLVMPFSVQPEPPSLAASAASVWLGEAAAMLLTEALDARGIDVVAREERVAAFDRLQLPISARLTRATTVRTAELLGASDVVVGEIHVRPNGQIGSSARLIRLDVARQLPAIDENGAAGEIYSMCDRVAGRLMTAAGWSGTAGGSRSPLPALDVFQDYVKGLIAAAPAVQQRFFEAAYRQAPREPRVLLALWSVYADQGLHARALAAARNVPADSPLSRKARFAAALSLIELSRFDEAIKELNQLNAEHASPVLWNALGVVQLRRPDGADAVGLFTRAVNSARDDADYLFNLGYAYARARDVGAALNWLRESVRFDAASGDAHLVMSVVLEFSGRRVEAQRELELAKLLGTRGVASASTAGDKVPLNLERLRTDLDLPAAKRVAIALQVPAQEDQEQVAAFHLSESRRLIKEEHDRDAIDELRRAIYLSPYADEPHLLLGRLYVRAGRLGDAIDELKVAIWCRETADARLALASALLDNSDRTAARAEAQRALALRPQWPEAEALLRKIDR